MIDNRAYIERSNLEPEVLDVARVQGPVQIERPFRSLKTVDLTVRPIYHRRLNRVRAHVLLCTLDYYVEWHTRSKLAPVLFDDHDPQVGRRSNARRWCSRRSARRRRGQRRPASAPPTICQCIASAA